MPVEQHLTPLKKCRFNIETKLMEALLIKRPKPTLNIKLGYSHGLKSLLYVFHLETQCKNNTIIVINLEYCEI